MPDREENFQYGSGLKGPNDNIVLKGNISWDGTADKMYNDFTGTGNDLSSNFTEIQKGTSETWKKYFERLQKEADKGVIIMGVIHSSLRTSSRGHVVALLPKSICNGTQNFLANWKGETDVKLPCAIEAGGADKLIKWFDQSQLEIDKYKWFKYEK